TTTPLPTTAAPTAPSPSIASDAFPPAPVLEPPAPVLEPPAAFPTPPQSTEIPAAATSPPPTTSTSARTILPASSDNAPSAPPPAAAAKDQPRTIDLAEPSTGRPLADPAPAALNAPTGRELPEAPTNISPDSARPAAPKSNPLVGIATVDPQAPRGRQQPQLEITKTIPANGVIGEPLVYSIKVRNTGTSAAHAVILEDPIPNGAKLTGTVPQAELTDGQLTWSLGTMPPGAEHKIMVRVIPTVAGDLGSTATIRFAAHAAAVSRIASAASAQTTDPVTTLKPSPRATPAIPPKSAIDTIPAPASPQPAINQQTGLTLDIAAPPQAAVGEIVTLQFTLTNNTRTPQSGVVLRNVIPKELDHPAGTDLEYPLPSLAAGQSKVIKLQVKAKLNGEAVSRATLASGQTVLASDQKIIRIGAVPTLAIEQSVPDRVSIGTAASLKTTISNNTRAPSPAATLTQTLAPGLDFIAASNQGRFDPVNGRISWPVSPINPGDSVTFTTTARPRQAGKTLASLVRLSEGTRTLATSSKTMRTTGFPAPNLNISGIQAPATVGRNFDITFNLSNGGSSPVTRSRLNINLPESLQIIKITGGKRAVDGKTGSLSIIPSQDAIAGGQARRIVVTVRSTVPGQQLLQTQFACDQLAQPLARTDAVTTLPRSITP
ncbi:MAG TPA: hypothetical protein DCE39_15075, partial [Planctomycetaceae bacterium]|nr:hypothetical protein [Planctomycetaceae bacterium]